MDAKNSLPERPEFNSLTEIMKRFSSVPYDQFQQELNEWFTRHLAKSQGPEVLQNFEPSSIGDLTALVSEIYHRAELLHTLSEAKISTENGVK